MLHLRVTFDLGIRGRRVFYEDSTFADILRVQLHDVAIQAVTDGILHVDVPNARLNPAATVIEIIEPEREGELPDVREYILGACKVRLRAAFGLEGGAQENDNALACALRDQLRVLITQAIADNRLNLDFLNTSLNDNLTEVVLE